MSSIPTPSSTSLVAAPAGSEGSTYRAHWRFDVHRVAEFDRWLAAADGLPATIDLSGTGFIDIAGITALRRAEARWRRRQIDLHVVRSFAVRVTLDLVERAALCAVPERGDGSAVAVSPGDARRDGGPLAPSRALVPQAA